MSDTSLNLSVSPHIHSGRTTRKVMADVLIALLPAVIAGVIIFGFRSLAVIAVCTVFCLLTEFVYNRIVKKEQTVGDLSACVTGLVLALNLPVNVPLWQAAIGSIFAIAVVKCLFGGIGFNFVNPALTARIFMMISFGEVSAATFEKTGFVDAVAGATPMTQLKAGEISYSVLDLFLGKHGGAIGETCIVALLIGFIYLLVRRVITWHTPVAFICGVFVLSFLINGFDAALALKMILSGGLFIGAVFMATDYVTTPPTPLGKVVFGIGAAILCVLLRFFSSNPEGTSFAIVFMNILNPYICKLTARRQFGGKRA